MREAVCLASVEDHAVQERGAAVGADLPETDSKGRKGKRKGGGKASWGDVVPDGAVVVDLGDTVHSEPVEHNPDLDQKFERLRKSSWRERLAAIS